MCEVDFMNGYVEFEMWIVEDIGDCDNEMGPE